MMPKIAPTPVAPEPSGQPAKDSPARHRYLRPTVREIRRHGEPVHGPRRAA